MLVFLAYYFLRCLFYSLLDITIYILVTIQKIYFDPLSLLILSKKTKLLIS